MVITWTLATTGVPANITVAVAPTSAVEIFIVSLDVPIVTAVTVTAITVF